MTTRVAGPWRVCLVLVLLGTAAAQRQDVRLELGFGGEVVAGAWNPLRLTLRDLPNARLSITLDQGTLRGGEVLGEYEVALNSGSGLYVFEDDIFIPVWRSLTWRLSVTDAAGDRLVASGSLDRRLSDARPLTLLVSTRVGHWQRALPDTRLAEAAPADLPRRLAAYDGVARVILDGSTAAPETAAVVAAAAAGAAVYVADGLPESYAPIAALLAGGTQRFGAGGVRPVPLEGALEPAPFSADWPRALLLGEALAQPPTVPTSTLLALLGGYALLALVLLRFAGLPGLLSALVLAGVVGYLGWQLARPGPPQQQVGRTLIVGAGELAREDAFLSIFSHPRVSLELPLVARPTEPTPYRQSAETLRLELGRWQAVAVQRRPRLSEAPFLWEDGRLVNRDAVPFTDLYVVGLGFQGALAPAGGLVPRPAEDGPLPPVYAALVPLLPERAALARRGSAYLVALPPTPPLMGALP